MNKLKRLGYIVFGVLCLFTLGGMLSFLGAGLEGLLIYLDAMFVVGKAVAVTLTLLIFLFSGIALLIKGASE